MPMRLLRPTRRLSMQDYLLHQLLWKLQHLCEVRLLLRLLVLSLLLLLPLLLLLLVLYHCLWLLLILLLCRLLAPKNLLLLHLLLQIHRCPPPSLRPAHDT